MKPDRLKNKPVVDADIEAAFQWYEGEEAELGYEFLEKQSSLSANPKWLSKVSGIAVGY